MVRNREGKIHELHNVRIKKKGRQSKRERVEESMGDRE